MTLALVLFWLALRLRQRSGLPWASVVADDTGGTMLERPLFAPRYRLTGKPDYLLERRGQLVPVEVKPGRRANEPYESDLMQLAAYCLLVEEAMGRTPPYGLLRYAEASFRLDYTPAVRGHLVALLEEMQELLDADDCARSHNQARRCAGCGFYAVCDERVDE
jgi:CRISPR-associated exonuclease Cas4